MALVVNRLLTIRSRQEGVASTVAGIRFTCTNETGALLVLKRPGHKSYLNCGRRIIEYMQRHLPSWYQFATERLGIDIEEKDLIFVSGLTKTTVWAEAAFRAGSNDCDLVLSGGALSPSSLVSGRLQVSRSRTSDPLVIYRSGPQDRLPYWDSPPARDEKADQCIFLNFYKMKRRIIRRPIVVQAAAGPDELPPGPEDDFCNSALTADAATDADGLAAVC